MSESTIITLFSVLFVVQAIFVILQNLNYRKQIDNLNKLIEFYQAQLNVDWNIEFLKNFEEKDNEN